MANPPEDLTIRALEPEDLADFIDLRSQPRSCANTLGVPHPRSADWRAKLENPASGARHLVAVTGGKAVACASLLVHPDRRAHAAGVGISVHDAYAGRGIGRALFAAILDIAENWLALKRIELTVFADNAAAIALYQSFGFECEGTLRAYAFRAGEYVDALAMARLRM